MPSVFPTICYLYSRHIPNGIPQGLLNCMIVLNDACHCIMLPCCLLSRLLSLRGFSSFVVHRNMLSFRIYNNMLVGFLIWTLAQTCLSFTFQGSPCTTLLALLQYYIQVHTITKFHTLSH